MQYVISCVYVYIIIIIATPVKYAMLRPPVTDEISTEKSSGLPKIMQLHGILTQAVWPPGLPWS